MMNQLILVHNYYINFVIYLDPFVLAQSLLSVLDHIQCTTLHLVSLTIFMKLFSCSVMSDSLRPHGLHQARLRCSSTYPGACSNSYPLSQCCHPTVSSCHPLLPLPSIFPSIRVFSNESGGQNFGASASASVLPMNIQDWFPLGLTGLILQTKGLSKVFFNTTVQKHQFFGANLSLWFYSHIHTWLLEKP